MERIVRRHSAACTLLISICLLVLTACVPRLGDDLPRPLGIGRAADGRLQFVVVLCSGERLASFTVAERRTLTPIWKVSHPTGKLREGGDVTVGDASGFETLEIPLESSMPANIAAAAQLTNGFPIEASFLRNEVPRDMADTGQVLDDTFERVSREEFRQQVESRYC